MSGHLVTWDRAWVGQTRRAPMQIELAWPRLSDRPALAEAARIAAGAAIGAVFGATTLYPAVWLAIGVGVGLLANRLVAARR